MQYTHRCCSRYVVGIHSSSSRLFNKPLTSFWRKIRSVSSSSLLWDRLVGPSWCISSSLGTSKYLYPNLTPTSRRKSGLYSFKWVDESQLIGRPDGRAVLQLRPYKSYSKHTSNFIFNNRSDGPSIFKFISLFVFCTALLFAYFIYITTELHSFESHPF